jgi:hypothetical protein
MWTDQIYRYRGCDVRYIEKHPEGGYLVFFRDDALRLFPGTFKQKLRRVHAKKLVFLSAGSTGSTEIILHSREHGFLISARVGKGLSGNGGMLAIGYDSDLSLGEVSPRGRPGPTMSAMVDAPDDNQCERSLVVQDGSWPRLMDVIFRTIKPLLPKHRQITSQSRIAFGGSWIHSILSQTHCDALRYTQHSDTTHRVVHSHYKTTFRSSTWWRRTKIHSCSYQKPPDPDDTCLRWLIHRTRMQAHRTSPGWLRLLKRRYWAYRQRQSCLCAFCRDWQRFSMPVTIAPRCLLSDKASLWILLVQGR